MYNGYGTKGTWLILLWIGNSQSEYQHWCKRAETLKGEADNARQELAAELKTAIEESNPVRDQASLYNDLMSVALATVDWYEAADAFLEIK